MAQLDVRQARGSILYLEDLWRSWVTCVEHDGNMKCPCRESHGCEARAGKVVFLEREPPVLFLCLTRAQRDAHGRQSKDNRPVVFPETLHFLRSGVYKFAAVIRHHGTGLDVGHYSSHVLLGESDTGASVYGYCNDDAMVLVQSWDQLAVRQVQREAYILVYHRAQAYQHAHDDGTQSTPYRRDRQSELVCSQGMLAHRGDGSGSGAVASSSSSLPGRPVASCPGSSAPPQPLQVGLVGASSSSSGSARTRCPRRTLRRSYTMYPGDGLDGDLPAPRMGATVPWLVSSLVPGHVLPEHAASASSSDALKRSGADLVVPAGVIEVDNDIAQQLANVRLESQARDAGCSQRHSQPASVSGRPKAMPCASRLLGHSRPRIVTGFGAERVEDVAAHEARRVDEGVRRAEHRRAEFERGRMRGLDDNDLDRSTGSAWHAGRR